MNVQSAKENASMSGTELKKGILKEMEYRNTSRVYPRYQSTSDVRQYGVPISGYQNMSNLRQYRGPASGYLNMSNPRKYRVSGSGYHGAAGFSQSQNSDPTFKIYADQANRRNNDMANCYPCYGNNNHTFPISGMEYLGVENYSSMSSQPHQSSWQPMRTNCYAPVIYDPNGNVTTENTNVQRENAFVTGSSLSLSAFKENDNEWPKKEICSPENGPVEVSENDMSLLQQWYEQNEQGTSERGFKFNRENNIECADGPVLEEDDGYSAQDIERETLQQEIQEIIEKNRETLVRRCMLLGSGKTRPSLNTSRLLESTSGKNKETVSCEDYEKVNKTDQVDDLNENVQAKNFVIDTASFINRERKRSCKFDHFQEHISKQPRMDSEPEHNVELNDCVSLYSRHSSTPGPSDEQVIEVPKVNLETVKSELCSFSELSDEQELNQQETDVISCKSSQFFIQFHKKKMLCFSKGRCLAKEKHILMREFLDSCFKKHLRKKVFKLKIELKIQYVPVREESRKGVIGYMKKNGLVSNNSKCTNIGLIDVRHANILYHAFHGEKDCRPCFTLHKSRKNATFDALSSGDVSTSMDTVAATENSGDATASLGTDAMIVLSNEASANVRTVAATVSRQNIIQSSCRGKGNCDDMTGENVKATTNTTLPEAKKIPIEVCTPEAEEDDPIGWGKPMVNGKMKEDGVIFSTYKTDGGGVLELFGKSMRYIVVYDQKYIPLVDIYNSFDEKEVLKTIQRANINVFTCTQQEAEFLNDFMDFDVVKAGESIVIGRILYHVIMSPDEYRKKDGQLFEELTGDAG